MTRTSFSICSPTRDFEGGLPTGHDWFYECVEGRSLIGIRGTFSARGGQTTHFISCIWISTRPWLPRGRSFSSVSSELSGLWISNGLSVLRLETPIVSMCPVCLSLLDPWTCLFWRLVCPVPVRSCLVGPSDRSTALRLSCLVRSHGHAGYALYCWRSAKSWSTKTLWSSSGRKTCPAYDRL